MKQLVRTLTFASLALFSVSFADTLATTTTATTTASTATSSQDQLLYVQMAKSATFEKTFNGAYKLTLHGVNPFVTYFTNRPVRRAGVMPIDGFITGWQQGENSFKVDAPNASMVTVGKFANNQTQGTQLNYVIELKNPKYNAHQETMEYHIRFLQGDTSQLSKLNSYDQIALFIDPSEVCASCIPSDQ